ncbi:MAG: hypothetical protein HPY62_12295, partial [Bacteroidales bacterium]|nr:hypothetical protein [Bacteroidales bacterium]
MRAITVNFLILTLVISVSVSCKRNPYKVNTSSSKVEIEIKRLEKDLFETDPSLVKDRIPYLKDKYGTFLQLFSYVINAGDINEPDFSDLLLQFCTDKLNNEVYSSTMKIFENTDVIEKELGKAFSHYRYYFPEKLVPQIYTCITGFNNSIITGDSVLGIGLERYLGADCEYYPRLEIYSYLAARMTPDYIVPDCMYGWAASEWDFEFMNYGTDNVLTEMIHEGKLKYFERCMLPDVPDEIIFGFTPGQMKFCRNNEGRMWEYLIEHDLIFSTDHFTIRKLIGDAPFTSYFTNESPGKAAVWIGFRIVESYMKNNKGVKLSYLMQDKDIQGLVEKARYNPP